MHRQKAFCAFFLPLILIACSSYPSVPSDDIGSEFRLEQDLIGSTIGKGQFNTITGMSRGFTAKLTGTWDDPQFTLAEDFYFDDGETDQKTWKFTRTGPNEWTGTREDVIGEAVAVQDGNVFRMEYKVRLASEDGTSGRIVKFRDVLYKNKEGVIQNSASVGFWGFKVGSVRLTIERDTENGLRTR